MSKATKTKAAENGPDLSALAKRLDSAVTEIEAIFNEIEIARERLDTEITEQQDQLDTLTEKRDDAENQVSELEGKLQELPDEAAEGPRGQMLQARIDKAQEKLDKLSDQIDAEIEPGVTLESLIEQLTEQRDALDEVIEALDVDELRQAIDKIEAVSEKD